MKVHKQLSMWASQPEARFQITVILKTNQVFVSYLHGWPQALDELGAQGSGEIRGNRQLTPVVQFFFDKVILLYQFIHGVRT
jgi:hypothetical protein